MRNLSFTDIRGSEKKFKSRSKTTDERNWILDYLSAHMSSSSDESNTVKYMVRGKVVCRDAWCLVYGIKNDWLRRVLLDSKDGKLEYVHGNQGMKKISERTGDSIAWLKFFVGCIGDHQPDKNRTHLPSCFTKVGLYNKMKAEHVSNGLNVVCLTQWYKLWNEHFPHVLIPKVWLSFWILWPITCICFIVLFMSSW